MTTNKNRLKSALFELRDNINAGFLLSPSRQAHFIMLIEAALNDPDMDPNTLERVPADALAMGAEKTSLAKIIDDFVKYSPVNLEKDTRTTLLLDALKNINERLTAIEHASTHASKSRNP